MIGEPIVADDPFDADAYLDGFLHRTTMLLGPERIRRLADCTVAIAGCGGVGGAAAITLARLGVGGFVLADPGIFDPPDANRQWAATRVTLDQNKAVVHEAILRQINPSVRIHRFDEGVTADNLDRFLAPADVLVDCLDISVPLELRSRVYRSAQQAGMYAITAPIFGFGTLVMAADPDGMGMDDLIEGFVRVASETSRLPPGFPAHFFGPHLATIEREIHTHRVPTSAIAVVVASGTVSAEVARVLLKPTYPELDPPTVLPDVLVIEPWGGVYRRLHYSALFRDAPVPSTPTQRREALVAAHHNPLLVEADPTTAPFVSDSWAGRAPAEPGPEVASAEIAPRLRELYGFPHTLAVGQGRQAEALLAPSVAGPGQLVVANALFPTTRWHLEQAGAHVIELSDESGSAEIDLSALDRIAGSRPVTALWIELGCNALRGQTVSRSHLQALRAWADQADATLVLDATRAYTNAARLAPAGGASLRDEVVALCALADAAAVSLTKDFRCPAGGFVGTRDEALATAVRDRAAMLGLGLSRPASAALATALTRARTAGEAAVRGRVEAAKRLATSLSADGVPAVAGGHALFVDARAALPHLDAESNPAAALARALYVDHGVLTAPHLGPRASGPCPSWLRCAIRVEADGADLARLEAALRAVCARPEAVSGLRDTGAEPGTTGAFLRHYAPQPTLEMSS